MSWSPTGKTNVTIQSIKTEFPQFDTIKKVLCIGYTKGFSELLFDDSVSVDVWTDMTLCEDDLSKFNTKDILLSKQSFPQLIDAELIPEAGDVQYDLIYFNGLMCRRILPSVLDWCIKADPKYVFIDKTNDEVVNERYYRYYYKRRRNPLNIFCHLRYVNNEAKDEMITTLKRYDL